MLGVLYVPRDLSNEPLLFFQTSASLKFILLNQNDAFGQGCRWWCYRHICRDCKPELHGDHPSSFFATLDTFSSFGFTMKWVSRRS
jgi:hypothetical protein